MRAVAYGQVDDIDDVIRVCKLFPDAIVVDYLDRAQLTSIAKYMGVMTMGGEEMTRIGLKTRLRSIVKEDRELYFEGLQGLTRAELSQCCEMRGLPSDGLLKAEYMDLMNQWLQLAVEKRVPTSLLVMSNMLSILRKEDNIETMLSSAVSMLNEDVVKEVRICGTDEE